MAKEDVNLLGPYFQQKQMSQCLVQPTSQAAGAAIALGDIAASAGVVARGANGLPTSGIQIPLTDALTVAGLFLTGSASGAAYGITFAAATGADLVSAAANNSTIASTVTFEFVLPTNYVAGQNINFNVNQNYVLGAGTVTTKTLTCTAYKQSAAGVSGANLGPAAGTITAAAANLAFAITGTTLLPGDRLIVLLTLALTETASSNVTFRINSVSFS